MNTKNLFVLVLPLFPWVPATQVLAAPTDIASSPLVTSSTVSVLPNIMFVLDDSGSMLWTHMPDNAADFAGTSSGGTCSTTSTTNPCEFGYRSSQCNGVYYDPAITYDPPVTATGTPYPNSSFTAAWKNGYNTSAGTVNLSTAFFAYGNGTNGTDNTIASATNISGYDTRQAAYYYKYSGTQTSAAQKDYNDPNSVFYKECSSTRNTTAKFDGVNPANTLFTRVLVSSSSGPGGTDERTNFANWFSYYRSRMLMMKTAAGRAFNPIDNRYRVGYLTLNNNNSPAFLQWAPFEGAQKANWYSKLYAATPTGGTPLREALANVGRMYARKLTSINNSTVFDPIQYSCQQNFAILSTDGYWNGTDSNVKKMDGTTVMDNQDSAVPRPFYDGAATRQTITTVSALEAYSTSGCTSPRRKITSTPSTTVRTLVIDADGVIVSDTTVGPNVGTTTTVVSCATSPRALQNPNPKITTSTTYASSGGSSNTLADVAQYYYATDLRTSALSNCTGALAGVDVCENNVPSSGVDASSLQHMTTFTLSLGASGLMTFSPSYLSDAAGDYFSVKNGVLANGTTLCSWQQSGPCNWPLPAADSPEAIDDLWHAAVNGRGTYFGATNSSTLTTGLVNALAGVSARDGSTASAATSSPNVTITDNFVYSSLFTTVDWTADLVSQQIDVVTGNISPTFDWTVRDQLDANAARTLYTYNSSTKSLKPFTWASLTGTEQSYFSRASISSLSQFCSAGTTCLLDATKNAAAGSNLVEYLRGDRTNEGPDSDINKYYRQRAHILGDIVNSEVAYVKGALASYGDAGYHDFAAGLNRTAMIYVGSNDGMLHAFNAEGVNRGSEQWAYIPGMVMPDLFKLADKNYRSLHQFFVDGTPVEGEVYFGGAWHTIIVTGLNAGGRGYFALDVTNPVSPRAMWEFTDNNMGYTFGNPIITKLKDGTWVVLVTSGYNNVSPGDGVGRLYVINAETGALIRTISTGTGSVANPSGLSRITAWIENAEYDNTALWIYGGDVLGNLWRFDINGDIGAAGYDAQLLATFRDGSSSPQPITSRPEVGEFNGKKMVFVGTGRYLGVSDLPDVTQQSFYAVRDDLEATGFGNPRADALFVRQTLTAGTCPTGTQTILCSQGQSVRTASRETVDLTVKHGWYVDFPVAGERVNTDPVLVLGMILFNTNIPSQSACTIGGYSFRYFLDAQVGGHVSSVRTGVAAQIIGNALATRPVVVQLPSGKLIEIIRLSGGTNITAELPPAPGEGVARRVSWRELPVE
jgi:type IV pilus assembly protein PilY1